MLHILKGVHQLILVPCGCWDRNKVVAAPVSSTTWFPRQRQDGGCSLQLASPSLGLRQWQTMMDKSQKTLYFLPCTAHFPDHCTLLIQIHVAPTLQNAPPCSTWLDSAPFGSGQLKLGSPLLLHSLEIFPHRCCFSALCVGAASQWNGKGMGNLRGCGSQGWSWQSPPMKEGRQNDAFPGVLSFFFPPKHAPPVMMYMA